MKKFLYLLALLPGLALAEPHTYSWQPVATDESGAVLPPGTVITYNVYTSLGCGTKTLATKVTVPTVTLDFAVGCTSIAVSASDTAGEGAISNTLTETVAPPVVPLKKPAQVQGLVLTK